MTEPLTPQEYARQRDALMSPEPLRPAPYWLWWSAAAVVQVSTLALAIEWPSTLTGGARLAALIATVVLGSVIAVALAHVPGVIDQRRDTDAQDIRLNALRELKESNPQADALYRPQRRTLAHRPKDRTDD